MQINYIVTAVTASNFTQNFQTNLKPWEENKKNQDTNEIIKLKLSLIEQRVHIWIPFNWLMMGPNVHDNETSGSMNSRAEQLWSTDEGLCSLQLLKTPKSWELGRFLSLILPITKQIHIIGQCFISRFLHGLVVYCQVWGLCDTKWMRDWQVWGSHSDVIKKIYVFCDVMTSRWARRCEESCCLHIQVQAAAWENN
jgi:hypothetical protein